MLKMTNVFRRGIISCYQNSLYIGLVLLIWFMFHSSTNLSISKTEYSSEEVVNISTDAIYSLIPPEYYKFLATVGNKNSTSSSSGMKGTNNSSGHEKLSIKEILANIKEYNEKQTILNENEFGPLQNDSLVIVIQVHTRLMYLRYLIISLAQAQDIDKVLLVFSHDYYDPQINRLIQTIDFCKVIQIFYPYSIQTHPNEFPGESENDCPRDISAGDAISRRCINALHPDLYGHYREAKFTQTKHHWWWKANNVFDGLSITRNFTGPVIFLEEDHYVAPDFIYMLRTLQSARKAFCPFCKILSLGTYMKTVNFHSDSGNIELSPWISSKHNMGMVFERSLWEQLKRCSEVFCTYDDYNWDWSLQSVSSTCLPQELKTLVLRAPRVFHIGECGVHHKNSCASTEVLQKVQILLDKSKEYLYPTRIMTGYAIPKRKPLKKGNGGWGDKRDHDLCLNMTSSVR